MWCMALSMGCLKTKVLLPPATKLGKGDVFTRVCDSVHRGGLPHCMLGHTHPHPPRTRGGHLPPSGPGTTPLRDQRHPIAQCMLGDTGSKRAVHILLECILVRSNSTEEHNISYTRLVITYFTWELFGAKDSLHIFSRSVYFYCIIKSNHDIEI